MLLPIAGEPLILHTVRRASEASLVDAVIVATDDERIREVVEAAGFKAAMTSGEHRSGSDRIAEVTRELPEGTVVVNVQGDEPVISPKTIDSAVEAMLESDADIVTAWEPIRSKWSELLNGNVVKVVLGDDSNAIYFSRSPMPFPREASLRHGGDPGRAIDNEPELMVNFRKHVGIYVYRREYLLEFTKMKPTRLEQVEMLEQLRALENGAKIKLVEAAGCSVGVDTQEDFERVRDIIEAGIDIRPAVREDLPRVAAVHVESWRRSFSGIAPETFLREMSVEKRLKAYSERGKCDWYEMLVAEHPVDGIVGFVDFGTSKLSENFESQIYSFYFLPENQRKGLGERMFKRCAALIEKRGRRSLCLDALEVSPYRAFYDKMGGSVVGRDGHKLGEEYFDTVVYGWEDIRNLADSR